MNKNRIIIFTVVLSIIGLVAAGNIQAQTAPSYQGGQVIPAQQLQSQVPGTFYDPATGTYYLLYDPSTGRYSSPYTPGMTVPGNMQGNMPQGGISQGGYYGQGYVAPGFPNTGAGGNMPAVMSILVLSAVVAGAGIAYLFRRKYVTA